MQCTQQNLYNKQTKVLKSLNNKIVIQYNNNKQNSFHVCVKYVYR